MSDGTLVVTATTPSGQGFDYTFTNMGEWNAFGGTSGAPDVAARDALHLQHMILSMEDGSYTKGLLARWLKTQPIDGYQTVASIITRHASAESFRYVNPNTPYYAIMEDKGAMAQAPGDRVTGNAFTPFLALYHYAEGNGTPLIVDLPSIGLTFDAAKMDPLVAQLGSSGAGTYSISGDFGKNIADDNLYVAAMLGRISMKTEGVLTIQANGSWSYNGVARAYNDTFDANWDASRGVVAQASTKILSWIPGQVYEIQIPGEVPVNLSGQK
ncbi:lipid II-degrading bacteriocin [Pantoea agglomerans]